LLLAFWLGLAGAPTHGQAAYSLDDLARMSPGQLDWLYANGVATGVRGGKVRGRALFAPGTSTAVARSRAARLLWQGKVFHPEEATAVNRFFGMRVIKGNLYLGESWRDGRPALILDYKDTSLVYAKYRDEIRQIAPGLYLGLMYARTSPQPTFKMYFALQACP
jgi:hypothetical protein